VELNEEQQQQFNDIKNNLATVKQRIIDACKKAGRDPASVRLLPVTKTGTGGKTAHRLCCRLH
jgi:Predicted enzyme with a TIM-barrel fold